VVRADERRRTERGTNSPSEVGHRIDSRSGDTVSTRVPTLGQDERRLLLRCARIELGTEREAEVTELLRAPLDWDAILFFARLHSVGSLLHRHVKRLGDPALVPDRARRGLLALYQRADYRNRMFARENTRLVEAMGTAGIPVIVQKGLPLAELVYGSLALRPLIDLIFMVPRGELMATGELLVSQGYSARPVPLRKAVYDWCCPQAWFLKNDRFKLRVLVKGEIINWAPRHRFAPDKVWARAQPAEVAGARVLLLSPVDLVLYLCVTADSHGFFNQVALGEIDPAALVFDVWSHNRLVRFTDIHEVFVHHRGTLDWDAVANTARAYRIEAAARTSLLLTEQLFGQTLPDGVIDGLSPARGTPPRRALLTVATQRRPRRSLSGLAARAWAGVGLNRQRDMLWLTGLAELVFPSPGWLRATHGSPSRSRLIGLAGLQASRTLLHSTRAVVEAARLAPAGPRRGIVAERRVHGRG
jgi:Uncharacterised nucleotidyltransferase